jgi:hypothetical protein
LQAFFSKFLNFFQNKAVFALRLFNITTYIIFSRTLRLFGSLSYSIILSGTGLGHRVGAIIFAELGRIKLFENSIAKLFQPTGTCFSLTLPFAIRQESVLLNDHGFSRTMNSPPFLTYRSDVPPQSRVSADAPVFNLRFLIWPVKCRISG